MLTSQLQIEHQEFNADVFNQLNNNHFAKDLWPIVYILSDKKSKTAYVGETTDTYKRIRSHLSDTVKKKLTSIHLVASEKFNKSATLDIESNLIKYMSGDEVFNLLNGNLGLANHNYYQKKEVYWDIFNVLWDRLRGQGIAKHSIEHINNSDLFKYSPYKNLSNEQSEGLLNILEAIASDGPSNIVVKGGAGTGKTILAIFLFKLLSSQIQDFNFQEFGENEIKIIKLVKDIKKKYPDLKMGLVVPMSSFRSTLKKIFKNIKGLTGSMVIGPAEVSKEKFDLLVVDESHRLRRRVNLGAYYGAFDKACESLGLDKYNSNELDWITLQSTKSVLFYDENQSIKPSDVSQKDFNSLLNLPDTTELFLKTQFRVKGGNAYVNFVDKLLNNKVSHKTDKVDFQNYEFLLFDSIHSMVSQIKKREQESGLSRLIAGYSWEWKSRKDKSAYDIVIDDTYLRWNATNNDWINSTGAVNEVGCIHTTQGYDLNYSGIIFGHEISYDKNKHEIIIKEENYFDKNGKQSIKDPEELKAFILNIYKTIMLRGIKGTYIYACDPALREYFESFIPKFEPKVDKTIELYSSEEVKPYENAIPVYDLKAAAGSFSELQQVHDFQWFKVDDDIKANENLFVCQVIGESMNKIIPNGSYCLFRKDTGGSRNGKIVLVESSNITDSEFGSGYTIKEYYSKKYEDNEGWYHQAITLKPKSFDSNYEDLVLKDDDLSQFKVVGIFEKVLNN